MPINKSEVSKIVDLDLPARLPENIKNEIKREVGDFIVTSILSDVGDGVSPVDGSSFPVLSKEYADAQKGGRTLPNLDLNGDMLDSLTFETHSSGVKVGIFNDEQAIKAFNHNTGDTVPKRQFIPSPSESFRPNILNGVREIVEERLTEFEEGSFEPRTRARTRPTEEAPVVTTRSAIDDILEDLF